MMGLSPGEHTAVGVSHRGLGWHLVFLQLQCLGYIPLWFLVPARVERGNRKGLR